MAVTRALVCVVRRLNVYVWWRECLFYASLFARRQMPWSSLQGVVKTSGYTLQRLCLPEGDRCQRCKKKTFITFMHLFTKFQLLYCLAHLHSFIYLLMWHFCYTEHVSFITIMFNQPFHYIIFILFYMIIIISVAVVLAAMFSLSDSLLTILFSEICIVLSFGQINMFLSYPIIMMAGIAVVTHGRLPHRGKAQMACNYR